MKKNDTQTLINAGKEVVSIEAAALANLVQRIDTSFAQACRLILDCPARTVVTGMGKSGHIASKIAATLASTGTPAFFIHPGEASHGDLGMIMPNDVVMAISNSGETEEVLKLLPVIKRRQNPLISLTGRPSSTLSQTATVNLDVSVEKEACPLGLAPTASTSAALAIGDAISIALLKARGFDVNDFAMSHPGGALGRRLLVHVEDVMHTGEQIPSVKQGVPIREALMEMTHKGLGVTAIIDENARLVGVFTDGDVRRALDMEVDFNRVVVDEVMTRDCKTIEAERLVVDVLTIMETHKINALPVVDGASRLLGVLNMHDLLRAGIL